jgi:hypothetical protein
LNVGRTFDGLDHDATPLSALELSNTLIADDADRAVEARCHCPTKNVARRRVVAVTANLLVNADRNVYRVAIAEGHCRLQWMSGFDIGR